MKKATIHIGNKEPNDKIKEILSYNGKINSVQKIHQWGGMDISNGIYGQSIHCITIAFKDGSKKEFASWGDVDYLDSCLAYLKEI